MPPSAQDGQQERDTMTFSIWMDGGCNMPNNRSWRQRLWLRWGRYLATRHRGVHLDRTCRVHPEARIDPRGEQLRIGAHSSIAPRAVIQGAVTIGDNSSVQLDTIIVGYGAAGRITIGDHVRIAPQVMMIAANHVFADTSIPIGTQGLAPAPITIEDDCWIAGKVMITAGVTIGRGSVIGAGAVVTKDIPPWSIAVGAPARVIRSRRPQDEAA